MTDVSFWQHPLDWLDETTGEHNLARGVVNHVEAAVNSLTLIDWVLLAVAVALIAWVWASLRAITRLGPIEVAMLEHDSKDGTVPVKALTAQLREALSRTGLSPPPAVPAGTPQINIIDAIKESPIPNANWIAAIVQLLPRPRPSEYHIGGVLLGLEPAPAAPLPDAPLLDEPPPAEPAPSPAGGSTVPCGLRFTVVPAGDGTPKLDTVYCAKHSDAVVSATSAMFLHISQDATGAFPIWARWREKTSLEAFVASWQLREGRDAQGAIDKLEAAKQEEPFNALADLQIANLYETCGPAEVGPDPSSENVGRAQLRAHAVRRYLEVADAFPEIVEARYRLAIVASALASMLDDLEPDDIKKANIVGILNLEDEHKDADENEAEDADENEAEGAGDNEAAVAALPKFLRDLANRQCDDVIELLRPWWALSRRRLRTQFEPKGYQRRVMRRTVRIARHCHGLRRLSELDSDDWRVQLRRRLEPRLRAALVHGVHLGIGFGTAGWQAHYNAACFDALLLEHFP